MCSTALALMAGQRQAIAKQGRFRACHRWRSRKGEQPCARLLMLSPTHQVELREAVGQQLRAADGDDGRPGAALCRKLGLRAGALLCHH